mmetsp:Transcript_588/g.1432  ORF Transcript_588/g.1432 Transcript_588/m.1432 type:complete len:290 (-) Transcript_588:329-1198(-)
MFRLGLEVFLLVLHLLNLPLLCTCKRRWRRRTIGEEATTSEHPLVPHGLEHLREILRGLSLDVLDLLLPLTNVLKDCLLELLVHILCDLRHLVQGLERLLRPAQTLQCLGLTEERLLIVMFELECSVRCPDGSLPLVHLQCSVGLVVQAGTVHRLELLVLLLQVRLRTEVLQHLIALAVPRQRALPVLIHERLVALSLDLLAEVQNALDLTPVQDLLAVGRFAIDAARDAVCLHDHLVHQVLFHLLLGLPSGDAIGARRDLRLDSHQPMIHLRLPELVAEEQPFLPRLA